MPNGPLSLEDLIGHETDPAEAGTVDPEYFKFNFHRDDTGLIDHEGYPTKVTPVATSNKRTVRASEDDGWRFFAEIRTRDARMGSSVTFLMESDDGEIQDVLLDGDDIEFLRSVTINALE